MEQYVLRIQSPDWTYLGGDADTKKPIELVIRAFDGDAECATGETDARPVGETVPVPQGEGVRLEGKHFFVRAAEGGRSVLISHRGLVE